MKLQHLQSIACRYHLGKAMTLLLSMIR